MPNGFIYFLLICISTTLPLKEMGFCQLSLDDDIWKKVQMTFTIYTHEQNCWYSSVDETKTHNSLFFKVILLKHV